jgi:glutathione synthase
MAMDVAVLMDPIESISIKKDSTFAMLLEAQRRGHRLHYLTQDSLRIRNGVAEASLRSLVVADRASGWFELGLEQIAPLGSMDVILLRKDPPPPLRQSVLVRHPRDGPCAASRCLGRQRSAGIARP